MKIYTKTGDDGQTGLFAGERVWKDHVRVEAYGTVDELNALLGVTYLYVQDTEIKQFLEAAQSELFNLGCDLATPINERTEKMNIPRITTESYERLEKTIDYFEAKLDPLKNFILPGGAAGAAYLHLARTICRRAERHVVTLMRTEDIGKHVLIYLNRLSDLLFVLARYENKSCKIPEILWQASTKQRSS